MKSGKYTIKELFVNRYVEQIIIPEIQRDYVWGKDHVTGLLNSIVEGFDKFRSHVSPVVKSEDKVIEDLFHAFYKKQKFASNIGFIYAYHDEQYPGRYFLIDGQQRITTLYLLLLALAQTNEELKKDFKRTYIAGNRLKLDYKVREASHIFMNQFVWFVLDSTNDNKDITNQQWYYADYKNDITINNLLSNYTLILDYLQEKEIDYKFFYDYIGDSTEFWYFDTNVSQQGEELYIYMNARGEQVQPNENIKADLLSKLNSIEKKNKYGKIWEKWQDFFWKHRGYNKNADRGFNEFLACISGLENYVLDEKEIFLIPEEFTADKGIPVQVILDNLELTSIERYVKGLEFLEDHKEEFKKIYSYSEWVDKCFTEIWKVFNTEKTNWYANYRDENRSTERNRMVLVWSILYYLSQKSKQSVLDIQESFRVLRLFYLRFNNYDRSVVVIHETVNNICNTGLWQISGSSEEKAKHQLYASLAPQEVIQFEKIIWHIEDHKLNLNGRDVGSKNISHLIDLTPDVRIETLQRVHDKFYELFPSDKSNYLSLQNALLYYGKYWYSISPYHYSNYEFNDWRWIIRNISDYGESVRVSFKNFFHDYLAYQGGLDEFLQEKRKTMKELGENPELADMLLWYNHHIGDAMWSEGSYIAHSNGNHCGLPDWQSKDPVCNKFHIIYNFKGDLRGGSPQKLFDKLPEHIKKEFIEISTLTT